MTDLIEILESFNRKERFFLIAHALGLQSNSGEPAFSLSRCFREQLNTKISLEIPQDSKDVFVAMDYHLDWLQAALILAHTSQDEKSKFCNEGEEGQVIEGTQEDVDLLVAFRVSGTFHLILVEAKGYFGWDKGQLSSKADRLRKIFGDEGKKWCDVQPYFCTVGPKEPSRLDPDPPKWMLKDGKIQWLHMGLPKRRLVSRCDEDGGAYQNFRIRRVSARA